MDFSKTKKAEVFLISVNPVNKNIRVANVELLIVVGKVIVVFEVIIRPQHYLQVSRYQECLETYHYWGSDILTHHSATEP